MGFFKIFFDYSKYEGKITLASQYIGTLHRQKHTKFSYR